jgi:hypothetical protein
MLPVCETRHGAGSEYRDVEARFHFQMVIIQKSEDDRLHGPSSTVRLASPRLSFTSNSTSLGNITLFYNVFDFDSYRLPTRHLYGRSHYDQLCLWDQLQLPRRRDYRGRLSQLLYVVLMDLGFC